MAKKIFLSPSNQSDNTYSYGNTNEAVQCGRISDAAKVALERCGFEVKVNHMGTLSQKVAESNAWGADLHIPIHSNACNGSVSGTRMFYYSAGGNSYKACKAIYDVLAPLTPGKSENITAYPSLYEMRNTNASSVYIEVDFHDVPSVAKWIIEHPTEIGEAICKGVCNFYGVTYKASTSTQTPAQKPSTTTNLYRIRKSWADAASQKGAYSVLTNAKAACDKAGTEYKVFDQNGNVVYEPFSPYIARVTADGLRVRKGPGTSYEIIKQVYAGEAFTIVDKESNWGLLKSYQKYRNGWICLDYTEKV